MRFYLTKAQLNSVEAANLGKLAHHYHVWHPRCWRWAGCLTPPWRQGKRRAPSSQPASSCPEPSGPALDPTLREARPPSPQHCCWP